MNTSLQKEMIVVLPEGFTARGAQWEDIGPAFTLYNRWSNALIGRDEISNPEIIRSEWKSPNFDPARDVRVVLAPDGQMAGYIEVWTTIHPPVHPWISLRVDPAFDEMGIDSWLLNWAEERAIQELPNMAAELRLAPRIGTHQQAGELRRLFENSGYQYIRSSYHMLIEMDGPVPEPDFPAGITLRTYRPETDAEAVYRAEIDSFRDHFGFVEEPFQAGLKRWRHFWEQEAFDPNLLFLAVDGDEIAGISLCPPHSLEDSHMGWVSTLGVRRSWRKRGLGLALLRHSFNEFYRRGKHKVGLGVDAQNLTGALRLYERAGMHVHQAYDQYEKELRPGREISVQSLGE